MITDKTTKAGRSSRSDLSARRKTELPVSRKFYAGLLSRVDDILRAIAPDYLNDFSRQAKRLIDNYLSDNMHSIPDSEIAPEVRIIFLTLKAEIDRARQRSIRARQAAAARRSGSVAASSEVPAAGAKYSSPTTQLSPVVDHTLKSPYRRGTKFYGRT